MLSDFDIQGVLSAYRSGKLTPSEVIEASLSSIEASNPKLNAFLQVRPDVSLQLAKQWESKLGEMGPEAALDRYPLLGVPIAVKDNFLVRDWQATAGSRILEKYRAPYTATAIERLEAAGAIIVGKANLDEFAMGSSNENSAYGVARNPWDPERVPGGSSGGSAVSVSCGASLAALGTDTGGSIRQPASFCGVVGLKPTYGRVSRYGIVAFSSSLDQVGPFGKSVWDTARLLEVMAGQDPMDATSSKAEVPRYTDALANVKGLSGKKIGIAREWNPEGVSPEVESAFKDSITLLEKAGATIVDVSLPHTKYALSTYYLIAPSEASSNLARYDGVHYGFRTSKETDGEGLYRESRGEGFGPEVKLRVMLGTYALSAGYYDAYYGKANQVRRLIQKDFEAAFEKCDAITVPTSPTIAFKIGEKSADPISMYLSDVFTIPANLSGVPAISIPLSQSDEGLPIGVQFYGKHFDEATLFDIGTAFEQARGPFPTPKPMT